MMLDHFSTSAGPARPGQKGDSMAPPLSPSGKISVYLSPGFQHNADRQLFIITGREHFVRSIPSFFVGILIDNTAASGS